jgi:tetratricopeptide (TPR) repeat protein
MGDAVRRRAGCRKRWLSRWRGGVYNPVDMQTTERMEKLRAMLEKDGGDPFLLFAMGMEHKKLAQTAEAVEWFRKTLAKDPGYSVAYHQAALAYEDAGEIDRAKQLYREGIAVARQKGDGHAAGEMEAALSMIE